jgi:serine/threonine protein kinase/Flp pilus assembly protein TadD
MRFAHFSFDPETDRLGEGPLSEVYRAVDEKLNRTVALKILRSHAEIDPQADTRFQREAQHTSSLQHPNIATIYEYGQDHGTAFIAMEYLQGRTLDKMAKDQTLGYEECLRIALQLTSALTLVHKSGLIHRDLKPANILVQDDGRVKLLDFGIARARDEAGITQHGMLVGTVLYMSPEQVRGEELDSRSDIFSMGSVLYHVMTGQLPFPGESFPEVCMAILDGTPKPPSKVRSGCPKPLEDFLMRCLSANPEDRYAHAEESHGVLLSISDKLSGTNTRAPQALKGTLLFPPLGYGGPDPLACTVMAGGVRKDLASELDRNKDLKVVLIDDDKLPTKGFDYVLRGELAVLGTEARLTTTVEVYDAKRGGQPTKSVESTSKHQDEDEWTLQADLVRSALRKIRKGLSQASVQPTGAPEDRQVEEARDLALQAHEILHRGTTRHLLAAVSSFRRALDFDRYCAIAYAGLAEAMVRKYLYWDGDHTFIDEAHEFAARSLTLDATCAEAHTSLGFAYHLSGHTSDAQREYRLAIQANNKEWLAHRLLGAVLAREGNFKNAAPLLQRAIGLNPEHIDSYDHLFFVLQRLDRYEEALGIADKGIAAAKSHLDRVPDNQDARLHLAMLQARMGLEADAREQIEEARRRAPKDGYTAFHASCAYALLGEITLAMELLILAQDRGFYIKSELVRNTDLDVLRGLPEFEELAR